jgi:ubiquinone/menaquinone biosynthesis C-methylase UbiE
MDKKTIDTYDLIAKEYEAETADFWQRFPSTILTKFQNFLNGKKILDLGSGPGRDAIIFTAAGFDVTCLDASEEMVNLVRNKGIQAVKADLLKMPFEDSSFDGVWAYTSLLHISKQDLEFALKEISRVLVDGGIFGLGMIEGDSEIYKESAGENKPRLFAFYKKEELEDVLIKCGFSILHFEEFMVNTKKYLNFVTQKGTN